MDISGKLTFWQKRLLDLGRRNKLIHFPYPKDTGRVSRTSLLFYEPSPATLWNMLDDPDDQIAFSWNGRTEYQEIGYTFPSGVRTNQRVNEAYKTLTAIMKKAREFTENKGLNALYLAFGFLYWNEGGERNDTMRSPLLLVPVSLQQESIVDPIRLSRLDDDITVNQALVQKMEIEYGLHFPALEPDSDGRDYLAEVQRLCSGFSWEVRFNEVQLAMFSFLKMAMYNDLEKNRDKILRHPVIRALGGEADTVDTKGVDFAQLPHFDHDSVKPSEVYSVLDADASQQDAILLAKKGVSFVLQGPPGTGKSQTITNIIAERIAAGKKVLFVSEKMAALKVVYHRMEQSGLGDFCLTLHDPNAKRKDIMEQLDDSLQLARQKAQLSDTTEERLEELTNVRRRLNQYDKDLHTPVEPLGKTIFEVNGKMAQLESAENIKYTQSDAADFTKERYAKAQAILKELARIVKESGYQKDNPWGGCQVESVTYEFRQNFLVDSDDLLETLDEGIETLRKLLETTGEVSYDHAWAGLPNFLAFCATAALSPGIPQNWTELSLEAPSALCSECAELIEKRGQVLRFLETFTKTGTVLTAASEKLFGAAFEDALNIPSEVFSAYRDAENLHRTALESDETDPLFVQEIAFRQSVESSKTAAGNWRAAQEENEERQRLSAESAATYEKEQQSLRQLEENLEQARGEVLTDYTENILTIDVDALLFRYQNQYQSLFRFLNAQYRRDRKELKGYSLDKTRMSYSQALEILDKVSRAQKAKTETDTQAEKTARALSDKNGKEDALRESETKLEEAERVLDEAQQQMQAAQENLTAGYRKELQQRRDEETRLHKRIAEICDSLKEALGTPVPEQTDFSALRQKLQWTAAFQNGIREYRAGEDFIAAICGAREDVIAALREYAQKLEAWRAHAAEALQKFVGLFSKQRQEAFLNSPLEELRADVRICGEQFSALENLIDYETVTREMEDAGLAGFLRQAELLELPHEKIIPAFEKCFYRSWLDAVVPRFKSIATFRKKRQEECIEEFRDLDKLGIEISKSKLRARLISQIPNVENGVGGSEAAVLRREIAKKRKLMPLRQLIAKISNLLPALKPCILMSPLSVSTYFGDSDYRFDTVIFDEASQVRTEDAIGCIFRGDQVIIAGDSKQLPPTDFFHSAASDTEDYEEDENGEPLDAGAYESLLEEASVLPTQTLLWHYRSKHEDLISFSNLKIYDGRLITFPSPIERNENLGVSYVYVKGGTYARGRSRGNRREAEVIADLVYEHFRVHPERSIGIIAFGEAQQAMIENVLTERRRDHLEYEAFFSTEREEPLFIRNLETVQGDERDTIIFCIGYARDESGKFLMNFGPLSQVGGERRLNVAVTRARYQLKLVGSIMPTDIDVDRISSEGPKLLRTYMDFAIRGSSVLLPETEQQGEASDSPFEEAVCEFITANGYHVKRAVGCSDYRIDMAVRHPKDPDRFALGILCDGASYHASRTARERDRLRQTILESMGWKFYRIWSTDWIKDPCEEGRKLLSAIETAIEDYSENVPIAPEPETPAEDFLQLSEKTEDELQNEDREDLRSSYYGMGVAEIPYTDMEETMFNILRHGYGYTKEDLLFDTARVGYGWKHRGEKIQSALEFAYLRMLRKNRIREDGGKVSAV